MMFETFLVIVTVLYVVQGVLLLIGLRRNGTVAPSLVVED